EAAAESLVGDCRAVIKIDCAEFQHSHEIAKLIGSPPGYLGHRETHPLLTQEALNQWHTEKLKLSLVLFDEIEKAHPDVFNILLQVLDDGRLTDGKGRVVSFKNTVLIMTSNLGSEWIAEAKDMKEEDVKARIEETLRRHFRPEFFNRIDDVIVFHRLTREETEEIVEIQLQSLARTIADRGVRLAWTKEAKRYLAGRGYDPTFGARPLKRLIQKEVSDALAGKILRNELAPGDIAQVTVSTDGESLEIETESEPRALRV
ncbi:MAG TPA: AAA family ATPase, partial [Thermoanaerobaculia bacterium]|nr:AAA family ATPase [Thermoanaerobaculia bacterium]